MTVIYGMYEDTQCLAGGANMVEPYYLGVYIRAPDCGKLPYGCSAERKLADRLWDLFPSEPCRLQCATQTELDSQPFQKRTRHGKMLWQREYNQSLPRFPGLWIGFDIAQELVQFAQVSLMELAFLSSTDWSRRSRDSHVPVGRRLSIRAICGPWSLQKAY